jgi:SAM-dependent methyltransferase
MALPYDLAPDYFGLAGGVDDLLILCGCVYIVLRRRRKPEATRVVNALTVTALAVLLAGNYYALNFPPAAWFYNLCYRVGAPWDRGGMNEELLSYIKTRVPAETLSPGRAIDLGSGSGAYSIYLARQGFFVTGVDFSNIALEKARLAALSSRAGDRVRFIFGDLTAAAIPGVPGPFDLLLDVSTFDDLQPEGRKAMAGLIGRLARPGALFISCSNIQASPWGSRWLSLIRFQGVTQLDAGEIKKLFSGEFEISEPFKAEPGLDNPCYVMKRRAS